MITTIAQNEGKKRWVVNATPMQMLAVSIIQQALREAGSNGDRKRAEALYFIESDDFDFWCEKIHLRPESVRTALQDPRSRHVMIQRIKELQIRRSI